MKRRVLIRLALEGIGGSTADDLPARAFAVLSEAWPGTSWSLIERQGSGRFRAWTTPGPTLEALRSVCARATGGTFSGARMEPLAGVSRPRWTTVPPRTRASRREPDLVLVVWPRGGATLPSRTMLRDAAAILASSLRTLRTVETLVEQNQRDALTGLLNRTGVLESLRREKALADRHRRPLSILYVDLDDFKSVNDRLGHAAGDELLRQVGSILVRQVRVSDAVGRLGGDEFLLVLADTSLDAARRIGRRVEASLAPTIAATVGAASLDECDRTDLEALVHNADARMLEAKRRRAARRRRSRVAPEAYASRSAR